MPSFPIFNNEPDIHSLSAGHVTFAEGESDNDQMYAVLEGEVEILRQQYRLETIGPAVYLAIWRCSISNRGVLLRLPRRTAV